MANSFSTLLHLMQPLLQITHVLSWIGLVMATLATVTLAIFSFNFIFSPLKGYPGPLLTNFTDAWRFVTTAKGSVHLTHIELHRKHGRAVRMGPNLLSLLDPNLLKVMYNTSKPWKKSRMYEVQESTSPDRKPQPNLFSTSDEQWHAMVLRPVGSFFTATNVLGLETYVDNSVNLLLRTIEERFVDKGMVCEMADYFLFFAWDAMSDVTFGEPLGFLADGGEQSRKLLRIADADFDYFAAVPNISRYIQRIPHLRPPQLEWAAKLGYEHYKRRQMQGSKLSEDTRDLLDKYLDAQRKSPALVDDNQMISYLLSNTVAGSHPTAYTLTAILYYVLKTAGVYANLREEIDEAQLSVPVSWKAAKNIPYLDAVIHKTSRIHPAFGLILERVVPKEGLTLADGRLIPAGTIVGMNPWVINRDEDVFGSDPDEFRPRRWLQGKEESLDQFETRRKRMANTLHTFGAGSRACTGRHLSLMETYKTVATFFAKFDIGHARPEEGLKVHNSWTVRTENLPVFLYSKP